jgi:hypothetical protein
LRVLAWTRSLYGADASLIRAASGRGIFVKILQGGARDFDKRSLVRERAASKLFRCYGRDRGFESVSLQRGVCCELVQEPLIGPGAGPLQFSLRRHEHGVQSTRSAATSNAVEPNITAAALAAAKTHVKRCFDQRQIPVCRHRVHAAGSPEWPTAGCGRHQGVRRPRQAHAA